MIITLKVRNPAEIYLTLNIFRFDFLDATTIPPTVRRYKINPDMTGAATFMHGYPALLGLGITLIRNQIVDIIPIRKKSSFAGK